jgi:hypothetical protein
MATNAPVLLYEIDASLCETEGESLRGAKGKMRHSGMPVVILCRPCKWHLQPSAGGNMLDAHYSSLTNRPPNPGAAGVGAFASSVIAKASFSASPSGLIPLQ